MLEKSAGDAHGRQRAYAPSGKTSISGVLIRYSNSQYVAMPTGRKKVSSATALWVSKRCMCQGKNNPKSGTMAPMTTAESRRQRASRRDKGSTRAAWEMVNGISEPCLSSHGHITDL